MNKKGFVATSVLYSLITIIAIVLFIIVRNNATMLKTNREDSEKIKEEIYEGEADIIFAWNYEGTGEKPETFPDKNSGYTVSKIECTGGDGSFNSYTWKAEVKLTSNKAKCHLTVIDGNPTDLGSSKINVTKIQDNSSNRELNLSTYPGYQNFKLWENIFISVSYNKINESMIDTAKHYVETSGGNFSATYDETTGILKWNSNWGNNLGGGDVKMTIKYNVYLVTAQ